MPLIGMFINLAGDDQEIPTRRNAFLQGVGPISNLRIVTRFGGDGGNKIVDYTTYAAKAGDLKTKFDPDLFVCSCWPTLRALLDVRDAGTPIVFAGLVDLTKNPATRYDKDVSGFIDYGANLCAQWPDYLSQIAPLVTRAAVVYDSNSTRVNKDAAYNAINAAKGNLTGTGHSALDKINVRSGTLATDIAAFATGSGGPGGLIVPGGTPMATIRKTIIKAAADNKLPAIYANRLYVIDGGLISRGTYTPNLYLKVGDYVQQILNGLQPMPVIDLTQTGKYPSKPAVFETVINLNTAKDLGGNILTKAKAIPADFVIEPEP